MKIAVTYENGQVFGHFGHCRQFLVAEVENGQVIRSEVVPVLGSGHSALAGFLHGLGAEKLICGGIGAGARTALAQAGIELYPGVSGDALAAVQQLAAGNLAFDPDTTCNHHHEEGHTCGEHDHTLRRTSLGRMPVKGEAPGPFLPGRQRPPRSGQ